MDCYSEATIQLVNHGQQDCKDLHSWGPGMRPCYIIHYVLKGAGFLECNNKTYRIEAGESFLIYPYEMVYYYPDADDPWEYVWVDFAGDKTEDYLRRLGLYSAGRVLPTISQEAMSPLFQMLQGKDLFHRDKGLVNGVLLSILGKYADVLQGGEITAVEREDNRLATAVMLIHTHYHRSYFHVKELCELLRISRVTLYRLFQKGVQQAPAQYLLEYRLAQAERMLEMGMSVKNAALSCGFSDPFYFSKMFKRSRGVPPSGYRKREE